MTSPNYIINYDAAGSNPSPSGTLTLTATSQNFTNGFFKFTGDGLSDESSFTDGSGANADTFSYTIPSSHFSTPKSIRVGVSEGDQNEVAFDTITLVAVKPGDDGDDAYTVILTNESHTLPTTNAGAVTYGGSGTEIIAFKGTTQLTGVTGGGTPGAGQFTATPTDTNITVGSESASSNKLVFADSSNCTQNTATISFLIKLEGASTTLTKIQSISKANQGDDGTDGYTVVLTNDSHTLPTTTGGTVTYAGSGTNIVAYKGTTELDGVTSTGNLTTGKFSASVVSETNITADDTFTSAGNPLVYGNASSCTSDNASITYKVSLEGTDTEIEKVQSLSKANQGATGTSAATLNLTSNIAVFAFDDSSDTSPTPSTATITINQQNQASNLVVGDITPTNSSVSNFSYSAGSGTGTGTATATITPSGTYPVSVSVTNDGITDSLQIPKVQGGADGTDGVDGLTIVNSNPTHTLPASDTGVVGTNDFANSGTTIRVFEGTTELNSVSGTPTAGQYKVTTGQSPSGTLTIGGITVSGDAAVVANHSSMSNSVNNVVITYTITGKRADGTDFTLTTSQSIGKNKSGTDGAPGSNAQVISLSSDAMAFRIAKDGTITPSTITFTANRQNIANSTTFSAVDEDGDSLTLGGSGDTRTLTATEFDNNIFAKVTATAGSFSDDITIVRLTEGSDAVTSTNSNPAHLFPADSSGNITSFSNSGTTIKVFEGTTALTFKTSTAAAGQFNIGTPTISTGTKSGGAISGDNTTTATVANYSAISADATTITYPISGKRADGTAFSFDIKQSFSKSKTGTPGAAGSDSKTVSLVPSSNVIEYNAAGGGGSGTITLTATSQNFTDGFFKFTGGGGAFTDETSFTNGTGANSDTATFTIPASYSSTPYTFTVSVSEGDQNEVASDTISIASIKPGQDGDDGEDAYTIFLTNETHSFPAANDGTVDSSDLADGSFEVRVFKGTTQLTLDASSPYGANTYRTSKVQTGIALTASTNSSQRKFTPTSVTADSGTAVITIIDNSDSTSFTKTYTFSKSKAGATGATGAGVVFRGVYDSSKAYIQTAQRTDVVKDSNGNFHIVNNISKSGGTSWGNPAAGSSDWTGFGAQFTSVATDILLAQNATITNGLVIGDGSDKGFIRSADATSATAGAGFYMEELSGTAKFRVGSATTSQTPNYLYFDGSDLDIRSQQFRLFATGSSGGDGVKNAGVIIDSSNSSLIVTGSGAATGGTSGNSVRLFGDTGVIEVSQSGAGVFDTGRLKTFTTFQVVEFDSIKPLAFGQVDKPDVVTTTTTEQAAPKMANLDVQGSVDTQRLSTDRIFVNGAGVGRADIFFKNTSPQFAMDENAATDPKPHFIFIDENDTSFAEPPGVFGNQHPSFVFHKTISGSHATEQVPVGYRSGSAGALPESGSSIFTISTTMAAQNTSDIADAQFNLLALDTNLSGIDSTHQNEYTFFQARHSGSIRAQLQHDGDFVSKGNITAFGASGNFLSVSDEREKKDIYTISESLDRVLELRPTKFTWIKSEKEDVGFIAQEVEKVIPEVVETSKGFINTNEDMERKTIAYPKLVPYLVDTIQQLTKRIEELEKKVK